MKDQEGPVDPQTIMSTPRSAHSYSEFFHQAEVALVVAMATHAVFCEFLPEGVLSPIVSVYAWSARTCVVLHLFRLYRLRNGLRELQADLADGNVSLADASEWAIARVLEASRQLGFQISYEATSDASSPKGGARERLAVLAEAVETLHHSLRVAHRQVCSRTR